MPLPLRTTAALVTGSLCLGGLACASSAQAAPPIDLPNTFTRLVLEDTKAPAGTGKFIGIDAELHGTRTATLSEAEQAAAGDYFDLPRIGESDLSISGLIEGYDLAADKNQPGGIGYDEDGGSILEPSHQFDVSSTGDVINHAGGHLGFDDTLDHLALTADARYVVAGSSRGDAPTSTVAHLDSYDKEKGTARVSGYGSSSVFYPDTRIYSGTSFVATDELGGFTLLISGIPKGTTTIDLEQKVDDETVDTVTIPLEEAAETAPVDLTNPANAADGYPAGSAFTFKGTARPNAEISIRNTQGTLLNATDVVADDKGAWEWTRANMRTATYNLDFIADEGSSREARATLRNFKPVAAPAPDLAVSDPANPAAGYTPNTSFTFKGTAKKNASTIVISNTKGTKLAEVPVNATTGAWEWTRTNMGTSIWKLVFTAGGETLTLGNFAPNSTTPPVTQELSVSDPANPAAGYTPNTSFTFKGTAKKDAGTIVISNTKGTKLAEVPVNATTGAWEWTRTNMGTSIWKLVFTAGGETLTLGNFAPKA